MKRKLLIALPIIAVMGIVITIACYFLFRPTAIISDISNSYIARVQYQIKNGELSDLKNYNEQEILSYLSTCLERRTLEKARTYMQSDVKINIWVRTDKGMKEILLGDINYSTSGYGKLKYEILNAKEVKETLSNILDGAEALPSTVSPADEF